MFGIFVLATCDASHPQAGIYLETFRTVRIDKLYRDRSFPFFTSFPAWPAIPSAIDINSNCWVEEIFKVS